VKSVRLGKDLALFALFALFVPVSIGPFLPGLGSHPLHYTDPFLLLCLCVAKVGPTPVLAVGALATLFLCSLSPLVFCRWMCPLGAIQRAASTVGAHSIGLSLPRLGRWILILAIIAGLTGLGSPLLVDPLTIAQRGLQPILDLVLGVGDPLPWVVALPFVLIVGLSLITPVPWCRCGCPVDPLLRLVPRWPKVEPVPADEPEPTGTTRLSRRKLILGGGALVLASGGIVTRRADGAPVGALLRPPGALPEGRFLDTCIRCGQCQSACPTGIIVPTGFAHGMTNLITPRLDYLRGVCNPSCVACQFVCPTGALRRQSPDERRLWQIGIARTDHGLCVRRKGKDCTLCRVACPFAAISLGIPGQLNAPRVEAGLCVGCGICENVCPVGRTPAGPAIRVGPLPEELQV